MNILEFINKQRHTINRQAYMYIVNSCEEYIYSPQWNGSDEVLLGQAHRIARAAKKFDRTSKILNKVAIRAIFKIADERRDEERKLELMYENHECGGCEGREFSDYGINIY